MSKAVRSVSNVVKGVVGSVTGSGSSGPGILGTGRFQGSKQDIDKSPFQEQLAGRGAQEESRKKQESLAQRLEARSKGQVPSIAESQLKAATDRSLAQQIAAAQAQRGGSSAMMQRNLLRGQNEAARQLAQDSAQARLQEQQQADLALQQALQQQRAQDVALADADRASRQRLQEMLVNENLGVQGLNLSGFQSAAQQRAATIQNMGSGLASMMAMAGSDKNLKKKIKKYDLKSMSDEDKKDKVQIEMPKVPEPPQQEKKEGLDIAKLAGLAKMAAAAMSDENNKKDIMATERTRSTEDRAKEARVAYNKEQAKKGVELAKERRENKEPSSLSKFSTGFAKGEGKYVGSSGAGESALSKAMSSISDEGLKIEVEQENKKEDFSPKSFLDALQAYSYEYKDKFKSNGLGGNGRYLSVMAQDLEKAGPVGKSMVLDTPQGKMVDYGKGFGAILAAQTHLNERLKALESKKKKN